jgi:hypothetical protein
VAVSGRPHPLAGVPVAAVWCFFAESDPASAGWVRDPALAMLEGNARDIAAWIRRRATTVGRSKQTRMKAHDCARYLTNIAPRLHYPTALANGWPVATGVIDGTSRHLVKDRMDIPGGRLERRRGGGGPQPTSRALQRRLRRVLALPHPPRAQQGPRISLRPYRVIPTAA